MRATQRKGPDHGARYLQEVTTSVVWRELVNCASANCDASPFMCGHVRSTASSFFDEADVFLIDMILCWRCMLFVQARTPVRQPRVSTYQRPSGMSSYRRVPAALQRNSSYPVPQ